VTVRSFSPLALVCGVLLTGAISAAEPTKGKTPDKKPTATKATDSKNQALADVVAAKLKAANVVAGADIRIETQNGIVELTGRVRSEAQTQKIAEAILEVSGVKEVVTTQLKVVAETEVQQAQATSPAPNPLPAMAINLPGNRGGMAPSGEPAPVNGMAFPSVEQPGPPLPPNAWPTYAPYNNLSRVAYPQSYPYNAFPFIGPFYPFPKVPPGWRSVSLEWEDGHWLYSKRSTPHDYWRVRFW